MILFIGCGNNKTKPPKSPKNLTEVDSIEFVNWINSFDIQPIVSVYISSVIGEGQSIVYAKNIEEKTIEALFYTPKKDELLYDGLTFYGDDFIMVGTYQYETYKTNTIPVYVRKSEVLNNWKVAFWIMH